MVLLVAKISKLYSKLENLHHHHQPSQTEALSASLEGFESQVSNLLKKFQSLELEILSFSWIQQCFELISLINKAFARLVVEIEYPASSWEASSVDEYLKYSLNLLDFFNSISSSLSHLAQARLSLSHGVNLEEKSPALALKNLKPIQPFSSNKELVKEKVKEASCSGKEEVIHHALMVIEGLGYWVCGVVLSGLSGDDKIYSEVRKLGIGFVKFSSFIRLETSVYEAIVEKKSGVKEVKEVNEAVAKLVTAISGGKSSDDEAEELRKKLGVFEAQLEVFGKEVNHLFDEVLSGRNQLLNGFRQLSE
ncbi:protein BPS1, chloroplastic-like [Humulus lupulus]|uniref:protein BPS1, chloroplastic-like n=1 Tax=Humulus lupulus TaxID=3486 RepID=UPI002B40515E|nr:protein BPS1, chloroplastic-like [Humulus lupulus]